MNTRSHTFRVLCYGDSNTWGQRPDRMGRFAANERWTGVLQKVLGAQYEIIEEGLSGRTVDVHMQNTQELNGRMYFVPCLLSQRPLHAVIIMLGTNDLKTDYGPRTVKQIVQGLKVYYDDVVKYATFDEQTPAVVFSSPIHINPTAPHFKQFYAQRYTKESAYAVAQLAQQLKQAAQSIGAYFIDAAAHASPGEDGIHMSLSGHTAFGNAMVEFLQQKVVR